ncbi:MAG: DUF6512 family protein [Blautia wexlerae]
MFTLAVLGGAALHFLYDVWPNPLTAVLAPVNESVWEHLKLLYWPFLAAAFVLARGADDARGRWCGLLVGLLAAPLLLLGAHIRSGTASACTGSGSICFCTCWRWVRGFARLPAAAQGAAGMAVRASCDRGRDLWGGAGAVFLCAAGSAYFPPVGAKKSAVCC